MQIQGQTALVTGAGSGLGAATAIELARRGAKVALLDLNLDAARQVAGQIAERGGQAAAFACDVSDGESTQAAIDAAAAALGRARIVMHVAGIGSARRIVGKDGAAAPLADFERVVRVNRIGTYNVARLAAAAIAKLEPLAGEENSGERGVIVNTASVAAFDGQIGQEAYAASKGGVAAMTLPLARDLASHGIRAMTIAPGLFHTPLMDELPAAVQASLAASIPFPKRLGKPEEFAQLACAIVENDALNGEVIRLDGALRMAPR
jgi:NAD(P)-dependent dehydrogenase (short-subunit alcohol dehydrogenase family)